MGVEFFFTVGETIFFLNAGHIWTMAQTVKNLPARQETWVQSLGQEDPLGEENSNPLQYPCFGSPMDRGYWWAAIHEVAKGWTRLSNTFHFHADHGAAEGKPGDTGDMLKEDLSD